MKLDVYVNVYPTTDPRQPVTYFASTMPISPGPDGKTYRVIAEVPDSVQLLGVQLAEEVKPNG